MTGYYNDPTGNSAASRADRQIREMGQLIIQLERGNALTAAQCRKLQQLERLPHSSIRSGAEMIREAYLAQRRKEESKT